MIPGLLQAPVYAEALLRSSQLVPEDEIRRRVDARQARQRILFADDPVHLAAFIDESVLYRMPGSSAVMHRQLEYLLRMAEKSNLIIRVVPMSTSVDVVRHQSFLLLRFPEAPAVVHTENRACDMYFEEPEEIALYDEAVHDLLKAALNTGESVGLITRLMYKLEEDPDVLPQFDLPPVAEE